MGGVWIVNLSVCMLPGGLSLGSCGLVVKSFPTSIVLAVDISAVVWLMAAPSASSFMSWSPRHITKIDSAKPVACVANKAARNVLSRLEFI